MDIHYRNIKTREDGDLTELYSSKDIKILCKHSYAVSIRPGKTRAKHYHNKKSECIFLIKGNIAVSVADLSTHAILTIPLKKDETQLPYILIEPKTPHAIKNIGSEDALIIVFSDSYDLEDTISYNFGEKSD